MKNTRFHPSENWFKILNISVDIHISEGALTIFEVVHSVWKTA
jgi:hypothetical protein